AGETRGDNLAPVSLSIEHLLPARLRNLVAENIEIHFPSRCRLTATSCTTRARWLPETPHATPPREMKRRTMLEWRYYPAAPIAKRQSRFNPDRADSIESQPARLPCFQSLTRTRPTSEPQWLYIGPQSAPFRQCC